MISVATIGKFLLFDANAIRTLAASRASLAVGFLLVLSAGFAREYDGEDLSSEPWHLLAPVAASLIGCVVMVVLIFIAARCRGVGNVSFTKTFWSFLVLYWMTAPLAWLYAIPVERFLGPGDATKANLCLLALVATWRVALMVRCVQVLYKASVFGAFGPIILFSDGMALLALRFVPAPIFMIMGGIRLTESENAILGAMLMFGFLGVMTLLVWLVWYIASCMASSRWAWQEPDEQNAPMGIGWTSWLLCSASLLIWIPLLPGPQREQRLRVEAESLLASGNFAGFCQLVTEHPMHAFPPHWDPPPRLGYGQSEPRVFRVLRALIDGSSPQWMLDRYQTKLKYQTIGRLHFWQHETEFTDLELVEYVDLVSELEIAADVAKPLHFHVDRILRGDELSESRRESMERLWVLGCDQPEAGNAPPGPESSDDDSETNS